MACGCNKNVEWTFEYEGVTYAFGSHALATQERRRLGATNSPLKQRKKQNA
jgi:hypothetical protein